MIEGRSAILKRTMDVIGATAGIILFAPLIILVPGGAFGPSKCWPPDRFGQIADHLIQKYNANVVVSVAPNETEKIIAQSICQAASNTLYNLAETPLPIPLLKALISEADLVITNDTGPRHIANAFNKKVITLFGPNNPAWTQTDSQNEVPIVGSAPCAPCEKPFCNKESHICMESISVETVCSAAQILLEGTAKEK